MNLNFAAVNLNGFLFYALFNSYGYFVEDLQTGTIEMADLFFALHALAATLYTAAQVLMYPRGSNRLSTSILVFIAAQWVFLLCFSLLIKVRI
jgi:cystinosin